MLDIPAAGKTPAPTDVYVGQRIRLRRKLAKLSQSELGAKIGVTFQQVQKYENGKNRVGASRLQQIADVLGVSPSFFFESSGTDQNDGTDRELMALLQGQDVLQLVKSFTSITSANARRQILGVTKAVAALSVA